MVLHGQLIDFPFPSNFLIPKPLGDCLVTQLGFEKLGYFMNEVRPVILPSRIHIIHEAPCQI